MYRAIRAAVEPLECRRLLSTINWTNKGTVAAPIDNFDIYGANEAAARNIVQRAIDDWERVIADFNFSGGGNTYNLFIDAANLGGGTRGSTGGITYQGGTLKPTSGDITLDDDGGGSGWYFDTVVGTSTVPDDGEFTTFQNPFQGNAAVAGFDFYRTAAHEIGHAMGLASTSPLLQAIDVNIGDDPVDGGSADLFTIDVDGVPGVDYTYTNAGGFHLYEGPAVGGNPIHPNELMNSGRTAAQGRRQLISDTIATLLRDAYNFTVTLPSTINTFYANLNTSTNVVTINGDLNATGDDGDNIDLEVSGSAMEVEANGTSEFIEGAQFSTIILNAGLDIDNIDVNALLSGKSVTINLGNDSSDRCDIAQDTDDIDTNLLSDLTVNGGTTGTDTLTFNDVLDGAGADSYAVSASVASKSGTAVTYSGIETFSITGSNQPSTYTISSLGASTALSITAGTGADSFSVANGDFDSNILGDLTINGGGAVDSVIVSDISDTGTDTYQVSGNRFEKTTGGTGALFVANGTESLTVNGSNNANTWSVPQISSFFDLVFNAGTGADSFSGFFNNNFDDNVLTSITFNGGGGVDDIVVNDQGSVGLNYNLDNNSLDKGVAGRILNYSALESFTLNCNAGDNDITMFSSASNCAYVINGNSGEDSLFVNDGTSFLFNFGGDTTFNGGGDFDTVSITDSLFAGVGTYGITNGHVALPFNNADVFFGTTEQLLVTGSDGDNIFNVDQTNIFTLISGLDGNDTINVGNGNFAANITDDVLVAGGTGNNVAIIEDTLNAGNNIWTITNGETTHNGAVASVLTNFFGPTIDAVRIDAGTGDSAFNVNSLGSSTTPMNLTVNAGSGNDAMNFSDGAIAADLHGNVTLNGEGGADSIVINDSTDTGIDSYNVAATTFTKSDWGFTLVTPSVYESYRLEASGANGTINMTSSWGGADYRLNGNAGVDTFNIQGNNVPAAIDGGAALDTFNINTDGVGSAQARIVNNQDLANLNIGAGGILNYETGKLLIDTTNANIAGRLNIADGGYIERGPASEVTYRTLLTSGFAGGAWNGPEASIISTAAAGGATNDGVGYSTAAEAGAASFFGVAVGATDMLIRYTLTGDNNLNGTVDLGDFANLAANFNAPNTNWARGNYNFDLITDIGDFANLAANFNQSVPGDLPRTGLFSQARIGDEPNAPENELINELA